MRKKISIYTQSLETILHKKSLRDFIAWCFQLCVYAKREEVKRLM
jgi:hypothetical protein